MNSELNNDIACRQCGNCCHVDVAAYVRFEDVERWEKEGRRDIIEHVCSLGVTRLGDRVVNRFGSDVRTCRMSCIYLKWNGASSFCEIYETRTRVCRRYVPGSSALCPQFHRRTR